jgi:hypothetical protein
MLNVRVGIQDILKARRIQVKKKSAMKKAGISKNSHKEGQNT